MNLFLSTLLFLLYLLGHFTFAKFIGPKNFLKVSFVALLTYCLLILIFMTAGFGHAFVVFTLGFFYLIVLVNAQNSVSLFLLSKLAQQEKQSCQIDELISMFNPRLSCQTRLDNLKQSGVISQENEQYTPTTKGRFIAKFTRTARSVLRLKDFG